MLINKSLQGMHRCTLYFTVLIFYALHLHGAGSEGVAAGAADRFRGSTDAALEYAPAL